eukprot:gb/GECH01006891.1/.p1 GENE.gb/GECH01006891.1/~~gb/GECH01006891.1/.p1  ORF type:complete len:259 (+),score=59.31 gb/GECH01006891.1/:1-777(+)
MNNENLNNNSSSTITKNTSITWQNQSCEHPPFHRQHFSIVSDTDSNVFIFGGWFAVQHGYWQDVCKLDTHQWRWEIVCDGTKSYSPSARWGHAATARDNEMWIFGGHQESYFNDMWVFNMVTYKWRKIIYPGQSPMQRWIHSWTFINSYQIVLFGGYTGAFGDQEDLWIFDTWTETWSKQNLNDKEKPKGRAGHSLVQMDHNQAVLFGGNSGSLGGVNDTWLIESRHPQTKSFKEYRSDILNLFDKSMSTKFYSKIGW